MNIYEHCFLSATHCLHLHTPLCMFRIPHCSKGRYCLLGHLFLLAHFCNILKWKKKHSTLDQSYFSLGERQTYIKEIMLFVKISIE